MYTLISAIPRRRLLVEQLPIVFTSIVIAELFYKFHSFTLELIAFFITWYVIERVVNSVTTLRRSG